MTSNLTPTEKWAILVGINFYMRGDQRQDAHHNPIRVTSLKGCISDVQLVEHYLMHFVGFKKDHIYKLTSSTTSTSNISRKPMEPEDEWPTRANIVRCLEETTRRARPGDFVYIHYSGHGSQSATIYDLLKGVHGRDEALVPVDFATGKPCLRDVEIAFLLEQMTKKSLVVTVVVDSCHSGSATRDKVGDSAFREVPATNFTILPSDRQVQESMDLQASIGPESFERERGTEMQDNWLLEPRGYVLLAACRSNEKAREYQDTYGVNHGLLTYSMIETLKSLGGERHLTAAELHRLTCAAVRRDSKDEQTPMVAGDTNRLFFGSGVIQKQSFLHVRAIDPRPGGDATIDGGMAQGVLEGSEYTLCSPDSGQANESLGTIRVMEVVALESTATVIEYQSGKLQYIRPGCRAILSSLPAEKKYRVKLSEQCSKVIEGHARSGEGNSGEQTANSLLHLRLFPANADNITSINWYVDINERREFEIQDANRNAVPNIVPPLSPLLTSLSSSWEKVINRLSHLAQYHTFKELRNQDPNTSLRDMIGFECTEILAAVPRVAQPEFVRGQEDLHEDDGRIRVREKDYVKIRFQNKSKTTAVNVVIFNLNPLWGIKQVYPRYSAFETVEAEDERTIAFQVRVAEELKKTGNAKYQDMLKAFVTLGSADFRPFELADINCSADLMRSGSDLSNFVADVVRPIRDMEPMGSTQGRSYKQMLDKKLWDAVDITIETNTG